MQINFLTLYSKKNKNNDNGIAVYREEEIPVKKRSCRPEIRFRFIGSIYVSYSSFQA
jgi:hypothetical protein